MVIRVLLYIVSYMMMVIGLTFMILYINLFSFGYNMYEYLEFIFTSFECILFFIGLIIISVLLLRRK